MAECEVFSGLVSTDEDIVDDQQETIKESFAKYRQLVATFPRCTCLSSECVPLETAFFQHKEHGWISRFPTIVNCLVAQKYFVGRSTDVFVSSLPKSGTVWLKDLVYKIKRRGGNQDHKNDLLSPHQKVPFLELQVYASEDHVLDIDSLPSPRLLSTHIPYPSLPTSLIDSGCPIVYIWRDPKAVFVSDWHFFNEIIPSEPGKNHPPLTINEKFECFCNGYSIFGPYWDHVLGYWNAKKNGANILLIKYEDLMVDPVVQLKALAEFLKLPFTKEEEKDNIIHGIINACSFQTVKDSKMYESGNTELLQVQVNNTTFLRKGKTNDWENYLTPKMAERLDLLTVQKFADTDLI
ncbi:Aryl sulfotransferase [Zostera marina]|uniref:Sulfotransferase n=1 Tax=Zostera marina TaxID=29655 RepID=A0A0K9NT45_ZOSMR|nr:Aryl sulfotransferase [Zostera marina]